MSFKQINKTFWKIIQIKISTNDIRDIEIWDITTQTLTYE